MDPYIYWAHRGVIRDKPDFRGGERSSSACVVSDSLLAHSRPFREEHGVVSHLAKECVFSSWLETRRKESELRRMDVEAQRSQNNCLRVIAEQLQLQ